MNSSKLKISLITVFCLVLALFSDSQSMEYNQQHIERGQDIFMNLNRDWDVSRNATVLVAGGLLQEALNVDRVQGLDDNTRSNIRSGLLACVGLIALAHINIAIENSGRHGNWSVFNNIEAQLKPIFYQHIGERYQDKDEIILETLRQVSYFRGLEDNVVRNFMPFSWFIPEFRIALNTRLEALAR